VKALAELVGQLEAGDRGYVHFSGHGVRLPSTDVDEPDGMDEVLCPHDFDWTADTSITDNELLAILNKLELGARMILSIDSCHSGDFQRGLGLKGRPRTLTPPSGYRSRGPTLHGFRVAARAPNVTFVSACSPWQTAADASFDGRANGAFTYYFLKELAANGASSTLDAVVAAIEAPLQDYAMTPVAENAGLPYLAPLQKAGSRALVSPLRIVPPVARAGTIVFEQHWHTSQVGQPIEITLRIAAANGELTAFLVVRAFGSTMASQPIRVSGNTSFPVQLGFFGAKLVVSVSDWSFGRGSIDFTLQLDLASDLPFVPQIRIDRLPVHIEVAQLTRTAALQTASTSPADLVALLQLSQASQPAQLLDGTQPNGSRAASTVAVFRDPRVQVVASGVAGWGPNWREDRIIRPFQDRPRPDGITRTNVPQIGPQRGSGNVYVVGWLSNQETDFDFVLHMGNHFFGGWGDIDWRVEGIYADIQPFPRAPTTKPEERSGTNGKSRYLPESEPPR
jgi:metacaspase-1